MNDDQHLIPDGFDSELLPLIAAVCDETASQEDCNRLEALLRGNPEAQRYYLEYSRVHAALQFRMRARQSMADMLASAANPAKNDDSQDGPSIEGRGLGLTPSSLTSMPDLAPDASAAGEFLFGDAPSAFNARTFWLGGSFALVFLVCLAVGLFLLNRPATWQVAGTPPPRVASIVASSDARWSGNSVPDSEGWLPSESVHLRSGQAEIQFVSGAKVLLRAPAEFEAISPIEARLRSGSLTARVDGSKTTFRIYTPTAQVVDLGTEFGLSVAGSGETDVAVFDGMVDVASDPIPNLKKVEAATSSSVEKTPRRLKAGEALRVDWHGQFCRITTVTDEMFPLASAAPRLHSKLPPPLILDIRDTLRNADRNPKFYRIVRGGFGEDARAYVDRKYEWNGIDASGIPSFLLGADYIMPFNDDKDKNLKVLIPLARPATVYVLFDDRSPAPRWLKESFVNTGFHVGMDEDEEPSKKFARSHELGRGPGVSVDYVFSVWKRDVKEAGTIELGPQGGSRGGRSMYGIVVAPLDVGENVAEMHEVEDEKLR